VGTQVFLSGGLVEIDFGRGIWQTVANQSFRQCRAVLAGSAQTASLILGNECRIDQRINCTTPALRIVG
jgi:hypothetical protein